MRRGLGFGLPLIFNAGIRPLGLGPELLGNGSFDDASVWTLGTGWAILSGLAVRSPAASSSTIFQAVPFIAGRTYRVAYTVTGYSAGNITPQFLGGSSVVGAPVFSDGAYAEDIIAASGNTSFHIFAGAITSALVDSVSVREVLQ